MTANESHGWCYSLEHQQPCQVLSTQELWGEIVHRVWLPDSDSVVRLRADQLKSIEEAPETTEAGLAYAVSAAKVAEALTQDVLLAPIESSVIPLPHQIRALSRAVSGDRVRYLLADEVGLGKTIEAGLILRELKLRGLVQRALVIAPKGLVTQWVAWTHAEYVKLVRSLTDQNTWDGYPVVRDRYVPKFASNYLQVFLRGTSNGWGTTRMALVADHTWRVENAVFGSGTNERFKFDVHADWSVNFGDNNADGIGDAFGADILISGGAGTYTITFRDDTKAYTVTKN